MYLLQISIGKALIIMTTNILRDSEWVNLITQFFNLPLTSESSTTTLQTGFKGCEPIPDFSKIKSGKRDFTKYQKSRDKNRPLPFDFQLIIDSFTNDSHDDLFSESKFNAFKNRIQDSYNIDYDGDYSLVEFTKLVNITYYAAKPKSYISPNAEMLLLTIKEQVKKNDSPIFKTGQKEWGSNFILPFMLKKHSWSLSDFNGAISELEEQGIIEKVYNPGYLKEKESKSKGYSSNYSLEERYYVIYIDGYPTGEPLFDYWENIQKSTLGKRNTFAKKFKSQDSARKAIEKNEKVQYESDNYVIYNASTFEVLWKDKVPWNVVQEKLQTTYSDDSIFLAEKKTTYEKKYNKHIHPWWQWKLLKP